jgi:hypothetical protein
MQHLKITFLILLSSFIGQSSGKCQQVEFDMYEKGLKSLTYDGQQFITSLAYGEFARYGVYGNVKGEDGKIYNVGAVNSGKISWDKISNTLTIEYDFFHPEYYA